MGPLTKKNLLFAAGYAAVLILGMIFGQKFAAENSSTRNGTFLSFGGSRAEKVDRIVKIINENYVDPVKADSLQGIAIQEILRHLDPHSTYLLPAEARLLSQDLEGNFYGIGIEYYILNDTLLVTSVNRDGPAHRSGILHGDRILRINNKPFTGVKITSRQVVQSIRGERGTTVDLLVKRGGKLKEIAIVRDRITISSLDVAYLLGSGTGYIKISRFGAKTDEDFVAALTRLQKQGMRNLVLDLRDNGGGYLNAATALADQFLPDKKLIVYTRGLHEPRTDYFATGEGRFESGRLAVLINENSASASEIIAGAIQDLDRGTIVGRRSFGKGLVQEQFDFGDGSALNLTVARYYTPLGRSIQKSYSKGTEAYYREVRDRSGGELYSDGTRLSDTLYNKNEAYATPSGKKVYGGGGIMPDIYIPADSNYYNSFYRQVYGKGLLNDFVFNVLAPTVKAPDMKGLIKNYSLTDADYDRFVRSARAKGVTATPAQIAQSKAEISTDLKALLARYYFGEEGFYRVLNAADKAIARSLEIMR